MDSITEHRIFLSCRLGEWECYDPHREGWFTLPPMPSNANDMDTVVAANELLVFGDINTYGQTCLSYNIEANYWSPGPQMNTPRCMFGSASFQYIAIVAGGCDAQGVALSSAELYCHGEWTPLPNMNKRRKGCSGFFMDGKFYAIGGIGHDGKVLRCGEEYDIEERTWRVLPGMSYWIQYPVVERPLVAVVNNELYAAVYPSKVLKKYEKSSGQWITLGDLPDTPAASTDGLGIAFRACGDRLLLIVGPLIGDVIEIHSSTLIGSPPQWQRIATLCCGTFVYNCAVMEL